MYLSESDPFSFLIGATAGSGAAAGGSVALEDSDSKQPAEQLAGLKNDGASCYLNSLIQCLYALLDC